jgi:hypothetical protein
MADIITLKQICTELKLDPRESRERLRAAARDAKKHPELARAHKARAPWTWVKGSPGEKEARAAVKGLPPEKEGRVAAKTSLGEKDAKTSTKSSPGNKETQTTAKA